MGLDQVAYAKSKSGEWSENKDIITWRKHPNLQGYMETLWRNKGGTGDFNCAEFELSGEDILELNSAIIKQDLPETTGFFFGSNADKHYRSQDLKFCSEALKLINKGYKVYYSSWY